MKDFFEWNLPKTISSYWDFFYKNVNHDKVFLFYFDSKSIKTFTYKELNAKAHCLSAYFAKNGLKSSDGIITLYCNHPSYYIIDLACSFIGLRHLSIPHNASIHQFNETIQKFSPRFVVIYSYEIYQKYSEVLKLHPLNILVYETEIAKIAENENFIILDNAIELGKTYWRENQNFINTLKSSVSENQAFFYFNCNDFITQKDFITSLIKLIASFNNKNNSQKQSISILISAPPYHILNKYFFYTIWGQNFVIYLCNNNPLNANFFKKNKINHWITTGNELKYFTQKWINGINKFNRLAIEQQKSILRLKMHNQNLPISLTIKSKITDLQRRFLKFPFRYLDSIHILMDELDIDELLFWNSLKIPIKSYQIINTLIQPVNA